MPEVIFTGAAGRIEGRYHPARQKNAPIGIVLHPHPQFGGTMNHQIIYQLYYAFVHRSFSALRFNFRGVGRSQGSFDHGQGELSDAASALDWAQSINPEARSCWIAGFSFGAWIVMQLLMRRPEIEGFISIAPPANLYDFSFLAPCPSSGMIVHGDKDGPLPPLTPEEAALAQSLKRHIAAIAAREHNLDHYDELEKVARYIEATLASFGYTVGRQEFLAAGKMVRNIDVTVEPAAQNSDAQVIVVGAHYDSVSGSPGADDNATGAAA